MRRIPVSAEIADVMDMVLEQLAEAQEAAETYWEAWQDAAVYWKDKVAGLEQEVNRLWKHLHPNE